MSGIKRTDYDETVEVAEGRGEKNHRDTEATECGGGRCIFCGGRGWVDGKFTQKSHNDAAARCR